MGREAAERGGEGGLCHLPSSPPCPSVSGVCPTRPLRRGLRLDRGPSAGIREAAGVTAAVVLAAQVLVGVQLREYRIQ